MKSKNALLSALLIGVVGASISPAASAFGLGDLKSAIPGAGGSSVQSVSAGDIDAFIKTAQDANQMIDASSQYIFKALGNQKDIAELEAKRAAANDVADPKEKEAALQQVQADEATLVQKAFASKDAQDKISAMNKEQLSAFGNAAFTFMLGVLKDKQLVSGSTALVSGVASNPMLVPRLAVLKDVASSVSSQAVNSAKIGDGLIQLASAGKIPPLPTSTSDKPKAVESI
jgi:hypothetical protein